MFVDSIKGSNQSCGSSKNPCTSLRDGVDLVNQSGRVVIIGRQEINATININKNVTIEGFRGRGRAVIVNKGTVHFAFKLLSMSVVDINYMEFKNISIITM